MPLYSIDAGTLMTLVLGRAPIAADEEHMPFLLAAIAAVAEIDRPAAAAVGPGAAIPVLLLAEGGRQYTTAQEALIDVGRMLRQGTTVEGCVQELQAFLSGSGRPEVRAENGTDGSEETGVAAEQSHPEETGRDEDIEFELDLNDYAAPGSGRDADGFYEITAVDPEQYFEIPLAFDLVPHAVSELPQAYADGRPTLHGSR